MSISPAHLHLILNHIPIIGTGFVAVMLFIAIAYRNFFMEKISLLFLVAIALTTTIVFKTGDGTAAVVQNLPGVSQQSILAHSSAARLGLVLMFIIGCVSLGGLLYFRKSDKLPRMYVFVVFALTVISTAIFIWIGYLGGQIMHPEIRQQSFIAAPVLASAVTITNVQEHARLLNRSTEGA